MSAPTILIITSSGGAGHLQAAKAEELRTLEQYPNAKIIKKDILFDWVSNRFGNFCKNRWNRAQLAGNTPELEWLVSWQPALEKFLFLPIFSALLRLLLKEKVDRIVDTQPFGTQALVKAIKTASKQLGKPLLLEKIVTELPTEDSFHFFRSIKNLSDKDRIFLKIISTTPLTKEGETEEHFWQRHCGVDSSCVRYEEFPLRPSFRKYQKPLQTKGLKIFLSLPEPREHHLLHRILQKGSVSFQAEKGGIAIDIDASDKVSLLMLGSHPEEKAVLRYVELFIEIIQKKQYSQRRDLLFVFCSNSEVLQNQISDLILNDKNHPRSLTIFPLSFQADNVIAPLLARSDATFTRSGGLTSMELLSVCQGRMWIHRSQKSDIGMPPWERGNALYLQAKKGATFINPATFSDIAHTFFE